MRYILDSNRITKFILDNKLTHDEFRKRAGITYKALSNALAENPVQIKIAKKIADATSIPYDDLIFAKIFGGDNPSRDKETS